MFFLKSSLSYGALGASILLMGASAQAQNAAPKAPIGGAIPNYTAVDAFGNLVRNPGQKPVTTEEIARANLRDNDVASFERSRAERKERGRNRDGYGYNDTNRDRGQNTIISGTTYYVPTVPFYPYPYPAPAFNNNYYYPQLPTTSVVGQPSFAWQKPVTITSIPLGGGFGGFGAPGYPFPGQGYGYPAQNYGYPAYGAPVYPGFPGYGNTTTFVYGNAPGTIFSQSQTGGYGFSFGRGGFSVQGNNQRSTSSTSVSRY